MTAVVSVTDANTLASKVHHSDEVKFIDVGLQPLRTPMKDFPKWQREGSTNTSTTASITLDSSDSPYSEKMAISSNSHSIEEHSTTESRLKCVKMPKQEIRDTSTATTDSDVTSDDLTSEHTDGEIQQILAGDRFRSILLRCESFRLSERETIRRFYDAKINKETLASWLLISGPSGSGKSGLPRRSLETIVTNSGGYFITGKFDFLQHPEPYKAIVLAFTEFTNQVFTRGSEEIERIRNSVCEAVGDEAYVITSMIPALGQILGELTVNGNGIKSDITIQRFTALFTKFLGSICSVEKPLVLVLDDLHWADPCSIDLIGSILKGVDSYGFHLIGAYDNGSKASGPSSEILAKKIGAIEITGCIQVTKVNVEYLSKDASDSLLADAFFSGQKHDAEYLSEIAHCRTSGNISCMCFFLNWVQQSEALSYDKGSKTWFLDKEELQKLVVSPTRCYRLDEINRLSSQTQDVLKVAACMGFHFEPTLIAHVLGFSVDNCLVEAMERGFVAFNDSSMGFAFVHDSVHQCFYLQIPEENKELFHVEIGRRLWRSLDHKEVDNKVFVILSQFRLGKRLISRENERHAVASLCLHAGKKAARASTFRTAAEYLSLGTGLLDKRSWRSNYDLCLSLFNATAEMKMLTSNFEVMDSLIDTVLFEARKCEDKIQAYSTRIYAFGVLGRNDEAIEIGLEVLKTLGETFPKNPSAFYLHREVMRLNRQLRKKSDNDILTLSPMTDERKLACMNIMQLVILSTIRVRPQLAAFVSQRLMQITLSHGASVYSSVALAVYGMTVLNVTGDVDQSFRLGALGLKFLSVYNVQEYLPRVYAAYYGCLHAWKKPVKEVLEPLIKGYKVGLQTGDIEFSTLCSTLYCFQAMESGVPLSRVLKCIEYFSQSAGPANSILDMILPSTTLMKIYAGDLPLSAIEDEMLLQQGMKKDMVDASAKMQVELRACQLMAKYMLRKYEDVEELASFVHLNSNNLPPCCGKVNATFFTGMSAVQMAGNGPKRIKNFALIRKCIKQLEIYSRSCPANYSHYMFLLKAEYARVSGNDAKALEKYTCALALSKAGGFLKTDALCNEKLALFYISKGILADAEPHYREACRVYEEWGAPAISEKLKSEFGHYWSSLPEVTGSVLSVC